MKAWAHRDEAGKIVAITATDSGQEGALTLGEAGGAVEALDGVGDGDPRDIKALQSLMASLEKTAKT